MAGGWGRGRRGRGWGAEKENKEPVFPFSFLILDVKSYLLPHCSTVGVCQGWGGVGAEGWWRGAGSLDYERF